MPCGCLPNKGIGRFERLRKGAASGAKTAPLDRRFISKPFSMNKVKREIRADVVSFLSKMYESVAETMPDVKDSTQHDDEDFALLKRGVQYDLAQDAYADELNKQTQPELSAQGADVEAAGPGSKKLKFMKRTINALPERTGTAGGPQDRYLPPGKMIHYWMQYKLQAEVQPPASFTTFWRVTWFHCRFFGERIYQCFKIKFVFGARLDFSQFSRLCLGGCYSVLLPNT